MRTILFLHPSADLYGSDKVLLGLVTGLDRSRFSPLVVLPKEGPLSVELRAKNIEVISIPLALLDRATLSPTGLIKLPFKSIQSLHALNEALSGRNVSLVHSNTLAVITGALWSRLNKVPHLWHVHEMIVHPAIARIILPRMVNALSNIVACISKAVEDLLVEQCPALIGKTTVVMNCLMRDTLPDPMAAQRLRKDLGLKEHDVLVTLVGRINRWKGQQLLVEAANIVESKGADNVHYLIMGSPPPDQDFFFELLQQSISDSPAKHRITLMGFRPDVFTVWDASDIAVVPSTEPEPFGLVAIEAMSSSKPVIAAAHGGLLEIVEDGITGIHFTPGDANALSEAICSLTASSKKRIRMGEKGFIRAESAFGKERFISGFTELYESLAN